MEDLNVKNLRILRLRFGLVGIASFYAPAKKETVANASGSERCVLIPWLFFFLVLSGGVVHKGRVKPARCSAKARSAKLVSFPAFSSFSI
jgi:hypothetical protein